jgi:hypothetical protein
MFAPGDSVIAVYEHGDVERQSSFTVLGLEFSKFRGVKDERWVYTLLYRRQDGDEVKTGVERFTAKQIDDFYGSSPADGSRRPKRVIHMKAPVSASKRP